jgi:hypothetical protein
MAARVESPSRFTLHETYSIAHSARCKLNIAANAPHRNLRFVLGHAFTLDKVLLRIVEIENQAPKVSLQKSNPDEGAPKRRISFSDQAKPSDFTSPSTTTSSNQRAKSPPPNKKIPAGYEDDDSTDSDDYDGADDVQDEDDFTSKAAAKPHDAAVDDYEDEDTNLGLARFASASAQKPRTLQRSPSPPPMSESSSDEDEDEEAPKSPPAFGEDVVRNVLVEGQADGDLHDLYEMVRHCPCKHDNTIAPESKGIWEIKGENSAKDNVRYGVVKV